MDSYRAPDNGHSSDVDTLHAEARAWARQLGTGRPTTEDADAFKLWWAQSPAHARAWERAASDWRDVGEVAQAMRTRRGADGASALRPGRRMFWGAALSATGALAVAAMLRPPLGLWPSWSELGADYRTATGEQREIALAHDLSLQLNTQTSVAVQTQAGLTRIELIAGEAAVQNLHAEALEVVADVARIRIAAGNIEVRRLGDRVRVLCTRGQAELHHPLRTVVLSARQEISYGRDDVGNLADADPAVESAWRQGVVVFENTPLPDAVAEINRYRPGRVMLFNEALARNEISGRFRIGALDEAITQIEQLFDAKVEKMGNVVLLT